MIKVTAELLKDLRKAQCVVFRVNDDNTYQLELSKSTKSKKTLKWYDEWTALHEFQDASNWNKLPECCFVSLYKDISGWDALTKIIKKDDELLIRVFTNNSDLLTEKDVVNDQLHVSVYRNGKKYLNDLLLEYEITRPKYRAIRSR